MAPLMLAPTQSMKPLFRTISWTLFATACRRRRIVRELFMPRCQEAERIHGASTDAIFDLLSKYPNGIADKYLRPKNRLRREIERAYDKLPGAPPIPPVSPGGAGAAPGPSLGLPIIEVRQGRIAAVIEEAEAALIACGVPIFERAGVLVEPIVSTLPASHKRETDVVLLRRLAPENVIYLLNRYAAGFVKWDVRKKDLVAINPPREIALGLLAKGRWRFPNVAGVITTPTMRPDGSLLVEPGYDKATQLYLMPDRGLGALAIPDEPSRNDALAALAFLDALLDEFPFVTPADRSVGLSATMGQPVLPWRLRRWAVLSVPGAADGLG